jgi:hypothetical protein
MAVFARSSSLWQQLLLIGLLLAATAATAVVAAAAAAEKSSPDRLPTCSAKSDESCERAAAAANGIYSYNSEAVNGEFIVMFEERLLTSERQRRIRHALFTADNNNSEENSRNNGGSGSSSNSSSSKSSSSSSSSSSFNITFVARNNPAARLPSDFEVVQFSASNKESSNSYNNSSPPPQSSSSSSSSSSEARFLQLLRGAEGVKSVTRQRLIIRTLLESARRTTSWSKVRVLTFSLCSLQFLSLVLSSCFYLSCLLITLFT